MKIDGKSITSKILDKLLKQIKRLSSKSIIPHLAVILIGDNQASLSYIRQKEKVGRKIGVKVTIFRQQAADNRKQLFKLIDKLNQDESIHGIIVQRPVPIDIGFDELNKSVIPKKDIDGFHPDSPFVPPVACAVLKILDHLYAIYQHGLFNKYNKTVRQVSNYHATVHGNYYNWLKKKTILIIGRGETAGRPIAKTLDKLGFDFKVADSKTSNLKELCQSSNIIISCVGKGNIVRPYMLSGKPILIGVGVYKKSGKLKTDYEEDMIKDKVLTYTPTPGGVGPVNVACLFENLIEATRLQQE